MGSVGFVRLVPPPYEPNADPLIVGEAQPIVHGESPRCDANGPSPIVVRPGATQPWSSVFRGFDD